MTTKPTIILTHDVDSIRRPILHVLKRRKRFKLMDIVKHVLRIDNLYDNIIRIVDFEDSYNLRSTFFIPVMLFSAEEIIDTVKSLVNRGFEVALHSVIENIQMRALLRMQVEIFRSLFRVEPKGVRTHYLKINTSILREYVRLGFLYDSSFRIEELGTSNPQRFKLDNGEIIELPIAVMDTDMFGRFHMSERTAFKYILSKLREISSRNSRIFVVLFHQESYRMKGGRIYRKLVEYLYEKDYNFSNCMEYIKSLTKVKAST